MAQAIDTVRKLQYSLNDELDFRTVGTEEWYTPQHYEGSKKSGSSNVIRPTFRPGTISVFQQSEEPAYEGARLARALYMFEATFDVADLDDIRVKESKYGSARQTRIEIFAVCNVPPIGHRLLANASLHVSKVFQAAVDTSD